MEERSNGGEGSTYSIEAVKDGLTGLSFGILDT
jgi:hypothetical protein